MKLQTTFVALLWLGTLPDTLGEEGGSLFVIGGSNTGTVSDPLNSTEVFTANGDLEAVVSIRRRCRHIKNIFRFPSFAHAPWLNARTASPSPDHVPRRRLYVWPSRPLRRLRRQQLLRKLLETHPSR